MVAPAGGDHLFFRVMGEYGVGGEAEPCKDFCNWCGAIILCSLQIHRMKNIVET